MSRTWNSVWREVHRSPTSRGHRIFECQHCYAMKTTRRNIPKLCEFCGESVMNNE